MSEEEGGQQEQRKAPFSGRDSIARALQLQQQANSQNIMMGPDGSPMGAGGPTLSPQEEQRIFGPMSDEEKWSGQFRQQMPPPGPPGPTVRPSMTRGIERMPMVMSSGGTTQTESMPNYGIRADEAPRTSFGGPDYPLQPEPSFEGQWSGDIPLL
jgi:hypothetical protein